jgi:phosphatidylglycerophosphate synthase
MSNGPTRKLEKIYENPFDNVIIDIAHWLNVHIFRPLHFTPNMLTTISLLFGILSPLFFHMKYYTLAGICYFVSYLFDCADGDYARTYNMVTEFGDYYDHFSDIIKIILLIVVILVHKINIKLKIWFFIIWIILQYMSFMHLGCQELIHNPKSKQFLSRLIPLCKNKKNIVWTRYFGVGTHVIFVTLFLFCISCKNKNG